MAIAVLPTPPSPWTACGSGLSGSCAGRTAVILLDAPARSRARISTRPVKFLLRCGTSPQIVGTPARGVPTLGTVMRRFYPRNNNAPMVDDGRPQLDFKFHDHPHRHS